MSKTNLGMIQYAIEKEQLTKDGKVIYILGGIGRKLTNKMINDRIAAGCAHTIANETRLRNSLGKYAFDCNALMKSYLWETAPGVIAYRSDQDLGVRALWAHSKNKGKFDTMPDVPGLMVFTPNLTHVGIYIGKNSRGEREYLEATPGFGIWGVGRTNDSNRKWDAWGEYHLVEYIKPAPKPEPEPPLKFAVGDIVYVTGRAHRNSSGAYPGVTINSRKMKIDIIAKTGSHRYHCGGIGWFEEKALSKTLIKPGDILEGDIVNVYGRGRAASNGTGTHTFDLNGRKGKVIRFIKGAKNAYGISIDVTSQVGNSSSIIGWFNKNQLIK